MAEKASADTPPAETTAVLGATWPNDDGSPFIRVQNMTSTAGMLATSLDLVQHGNITGRPKRSKRETQVRRRHAALASTWQAQAQAITSKALFNQSAVCATLSAAVNGNDADVRAEVQTWLKASAAADGEDAATPVPHVLAQQHTFYADVGPWLVLSDPAGALSAAIAAEAPHTTVVSVPWDPRRRAYEYSGQSVVCGCDSWRRVSAARAVASGAPSAAQCDATAAACWPKQEAWYDPQLWAQRLAVPSAPVLDAGTSPQLLRLLQEHHAYFSVVVMATLEELDAFLMPDEVEDALAQLLRISKNVVVPANLPDGTLFSYWEDTQALVQAAAAKLGVHIHTWKLAKQSSSSSNAWSWPAWQAGASAGQAASQGVRAQFPDRAPTSWLVVSLGPELPKPAATPKESVHNSLSFSKSTAASSSSSLASGKHGGSSSSSSEPEHQPLPDTCLLTERTLSKLGAPRLHAVHDAAQLPTELRRHAPDTVQRAGLWAYYLQASVPLPVLIAAGLHREYALAAWDQLISRHAGTGSAHTTAVAAAAAHVAQAWPQYYEHGLTLSTVPLWTHPRAIGWLGSALIYSSATPPQPWMAASRGMSEHAEKVLRKRHGAPAAKKFASTGHGTPAGHSAASETAGNKASTLAGSSVSKPAGSSSLHTKGGTGTQAGHAAAKSRAQLQDDTPAQQVDGTTGIAGRLARSNTTQAATADAGQSVASRHSKARKLQHAMEQTADASFPRGSGAAAMQAVLDVAASKYPDSADQDDWFFQLYMKLEDEAAGHSLGSQGHTSGVKGALKQRTHAAAARNFEQAYHQGMWQLVQSEMACSVTAVRATVTRGATSVVDVSRTGRSDKRPMPLQEWQGMCQPADPCCIPASAQFEAAWTGVVLAEDAGMLAVKVGQIFHRASIMAWHEDHSRAESQRGLAQLMGVGNVLAGHAPLAPAGEEQRSALREHALSSIARVGQHARFGVLGMRAWREVLLHGMTSGSIARVVERAQQAGSSAFLPLPHVGALLHALVVLHAGPGPSQAAFGTEALYAGSQAQSTLLQGMATPASADFQHPSGMVSVQEAVQAGPHVNASQSVTRAVLLSQGSAHSVSVLGAVQRKLDVDFDVATWQHALAIAAQANDDSADQWRPVVHVLHTARSGMVARLDAAPWAQRVDAPVLKSMVQGELGYIAADAKLASVVLAPEGMAQSGTVLRRARARLAPLPNFSVHGLLSFGVGNADAARIARASLALPWGQVPADAVVAPWSAFVHASTVRDLSLTVALMSKLDMEQALAAAQSVLGPAALDSVPTSAAALSIPLLHSQANVHATTRLATAHTSANTIMQSMQESGVDSGGSPGTFSFLSMSAGMGIVPLSVALRWPNATVISVESSKFATNMHAAAAAVQGARNGMVTRGSADSRTLRKLAASPEFFRYAHGASPLVDVLYQSGRKEAAEYTYFLTLLAANSYFHLPKDSAFIMTQRWLQQYPRAACVAADDPASWRVVLPAAWKASQWREHSTGGMLGRRDAGISLVYELLHSAHRQQQTSLYPDIVNGDKARVQSAMATRLASADGTPSDIVQVTLGSAKRTVQHHFDAQVDGHKRTYHMRVTYNSSSPSAGVPQLGQRAAVDPAGAGCHPNGQRGGYTCVHLHRAKDAAYIPYTTLHGVTLITVLRLGLLPALRVQAFHDFIQIPVYEDMAPWNIVFMGQRMDYIDYDTKDHTYDKLIPVAFQLMEALFNYKRTVEDLKQCGPKASVLYDFPFVGDCVGGMPAKSKCTEPEAPVPCGDGTCTTDYITCLRRTAKADKWHTVPAWAREEEEDES